MFSKTVRLLNLKLIQTTSRVWCIPWYIILYWNALYKFEKSHFVIPPGYLLVHGCVVFHSTGLFTLVCCDNCARNFCPNIMCRCVKLPWPCHLHFTLLYLWIFNMFYYLLTMFIVCYCICKDMTFLLSTDHVHCMFLYSR